jgi:Tol biopolymer transport system component
VYTGSPRTARFAAGLVSVVMLAGAAADTARPADRPGVAIRPVAELGPAYRLGFTGADQPALRIWSPGHPAAPALPSGLDAADFDADARAGSLVFVSRRSADPAGATASADPVDPAGKRDGDLYLLRAGTKALVRLTGDAAVDRHPVLSPDGRQVAFSSDRAGSQDVWLIGTDGSGLRRLTDHPGEDTWPTWSPDGTRIAFASTRDDPRGDIYVVGAAGGTPTRLTSDAAADTEPAWSPDGTRIAFTTTRFSAAGDVVTMPAGGAVPLNGARPPGGGPVTRAVPAPWDSGQAAWAADGSRLAVVTHRDDRAGDVVAVAGDTVTVVAARPGLPESRPSWLGDAVVYTDQANVGSADVWSADPGGGDRRDLTGRPGLSEHGPAFTADGLRLAYSADQPGGGSRVTVADADGSHAVQISPAGTLPGDRDVDPTWSPDGRMLAFTRVRGDIEISSSWIVVVRAADGQQVGELPVPDYLSGDDRQPAWSPDGTRIALSRTAFRRTSGLTSPRTDRPALPGGEFTVDQSVPTPKIPPNPDVVFLIDNTASMAPVISQLTANVIDLIGNIRSEQPNARFAVTTFAGQGDPQMYDRRLALTFQDTAVKDAIAGIHADSDYGDENWFYALTRIAADDDSDGVHFRPDSSKIIVLISDTWSHARTTPDGKPISIEALTAALTTAGAYFIGVPITGTSEDPMSNDPDHVAEHLADQTGGKITPGSTPEQMIEAIRGGVRALTLTVRPVVEHCDDGLGVDFKPDPARVPAGTPAGFTETVHVAGTARPGTRLHCTVRFDTSSATPQASSRQEITVTVAYPDRPFVRVDDVTVDAAGPDGARVEYSASAIDPTGVRLPTSCTPPSGSLFGVGQTIVTCTATGRGGTGTDTAAITVVAPGADGRTHLWLARLTVGPDGRLNFGDQQDLSVRVGAGCPGVANVDEAPAWAPDGTRLAFVTRDYEAPSRLCVAGGDGGGARDPLSADPAGYADLADPAWSPDGADLAYASLPPSERGGWQIRTVATAGGPSILDIAADGGAEQPVYQVLAPSDLRVTVGLSRQPGYVGGDDLTATYTVVNGSRRRATNAWLSINLPVALGPAVTDTRCVGAGTAVCRLGDLGVGESTVVTAVLHPTQAVDTVAAGRLTATVGEREPASREASTPLVVAAPAIVTDPPIGPPGFVTAVRGVNFPPGATVRLTWQPGITAAPDTVVVNPDGTFGRQQLVMRKDTQGVRRLQATWVRDGQRFGPVGTDFLVVPGALQPPVFDGRR